MALKKVWANLTTISLWMLLVLLAVWSSSQAQEASSVRVVRGQGAILRGDQAKARESAIDSSFRQALEQTVAGLLDPDTSVSHIQVLNERIYQRAPQYIRSYRVLWEYPDLQQQVYRVELEVEVSIKAVAQTIFSLGLSQAGPEMRRERTRHLEWALAWSLEKGLESSLA
jgi:hypothetical protein